MSDADYIATARNDSTWREIEASFAIEGMQMTDDNLVVAGKMIAGEIDLREAMRMIRAKAGVPAAASELPIGEAVH